MSRLPSPGALYASFWIGLAVIGYDGMAAWAAEVEPEQSAGGLQACPGQDGYFKLPGSSVCLRIGGEIYTQNSRGWGKELRIVPSFIGAEPVAAVSSTEISESFTGVSSHADLNIRTRSETDLGELLGSLSIRVSPTAAGASGSGIARTEPAADVELQEAYIQLAGLTVGRATSYFDVGTGYTETAGLSSDRTVDMLAFSKVLRKGFTATISLETARRSAEGTWAQYPTSEHLPDLVLVADYEPGRPWFRLAAAAHQVEDPRSTSGKRLGLAALAATGYRFQYGGDSKGRFILTGAVARGAIDYLGIPVNAPDFILGPGKRIGLTSGYSGLLSYEHIWRGKMEAAATASLYSTRTRAGDIDWRTRGFWLGVGAAYLGVPGLKIGVDVTRYYDKAFDAHRKQGAEAKSTVAFSYIRRSF